jgi:DNA-binding winged helix-turn-helix (wHTH) protein
LVEVISCDSQKLEYSYYVLLDSLKNDSVIPCMNRPLIKDCYEFKISILNSNTSTINTSDIAQFKADETSTPFYNSFNKVVVIVLLFILISSVSYFGKKWKNKSLIKGKIVLGEFLFDPKNSALIFSDKRVELTGKESDLLHYLYKNANQTIQREALLKEVWGDEGAYVGRTLDVFVSKLRKKLESNVKIKLVNVRGVGYKLILND